MASKKKNKASLAARGAKPAQVAPARVPSTASGDWLVAGVYGAFFFVLFLVFSPLLESKFTLPKLLALRVGLLAFSLLALWRAWRGAAFSAPRAVLLLAVALGLWWLATTPFAVHLQTALDGAENRYDGLWTHLCWLALFFVALVMPQDAPTARRIVGLLVFACAAVAAINLSESAGLTRFGLGEVSTLGNRVAVAALLNFALPFAVIALVRGRSWPSRAGWFALTMLLFLGDLSSKGRAPWIGLLLSFAILAWGLARRRFARKGIGVVVIGLMLAAALATTLSPTIGQRFATFAHPLQDASLTQRFVYYEAALRAAREHPIAGIGFENFRNVYPLYRGDDPNFLRNVIPTMVHNGYLERALMNGVPSLLLYLALVGAVLALLAAAWRKEAEGERSDLLLGFFAVLAAYLLQDLTGWMDIALTSVFWIMLGLAANLAGRSLPQPQAGLTRLPALAVSTVAALFSLFLLYDGAVRVDADAALYRARALDVRSRWQTAEALARNALHGLPRDGGTEAAAAEIYARRFLATGDADAYARAQALFQSSYRDNPYDRLQLLNFVQLEAEALDRGTLREPSAFANEAIGLLAKTDLDNPRYHETKARYFAAQGRFESALQAVREARALAPQDKQLAELEREYRSHLGR